MLRLAITPRGRQQSIDRPERRDFRAFWTLPLSTIRSLRLASACLHQIFDGRNVVGGRNGELIHRNDLNIGDQGVAGAGPADQILELQFLLPYGRLRVDERQLADSHLVLRGGDVELRERAQIESSLAFVVESLRGVESALFGLQVFVIANQRIVGIQNIHDDAGNLRLEVQIRILQVHLRHRDVSRH